MVRRTKLLFDPSSKETRKALREWRRLLAPKRKIRAYFDADIPVSVAVRARKTLGWDVLAVQESPDLSRRDDTFHYSNSRRLRRLLFTLDRGFLDDHRHPLRQSPGVFVIGASQSHPTDIYFGVELAALFLEEAFRKVPQFLSGVKVNVTLEAQTIRFLTKQSEVVELVAPWFPKGAFK
jgi:hypothetical protein